jgi:hypothetical protein
MDSEPDALATRRGNIGRRLDAIRERLGELAAERQSGSGQATPGERLIAAYRHAAVSQAAAEAAIASSMAAFSRAAEAHDHLAALYERLAAAGSYARGSYLEQAESHRAAATADRERANRAQSLLADAGQPAETA